MKNNRPTSNVSYVSAFLIGIILFWSFGKELLNLESALVFLAGLIGIALAVFIFGVLAIRNNSNH